MSLGVFRQVLLGRGVQRSPVEGRKKGVVPSDKENLKKDVHTS